MAATKTKSPPKTKESEAPAAERLLSLDAYRGFVILTMIFVNYLHSIPNISPFLKHAGATEDKFTLPDLVFPGFLMMVGLAIPLAFAKKLDQPWLPMLRRIAWRAVILLAAGVVYESNWRYDDKAALLGKSLYYVIFYACLILLWWQGEKKKPWMTWSAAGVLVVLMLLFRGTVGDGFTTPYLEHSWWGILGLIGWAYALCSMLFLVTRGNGTALMGCLALMVALYLGDREGRLNFLPEAVRNFVSIGTVFGSTAANVMVGVIAGRWFVSPPAAMASGTASAHRQRLIRLVIFGVALVAAAYLMRPFHGGFSKISATISFMAVSGGISMLAFALFYFLIDVLKWRRWAAILVPAGVNALFAYIIPDLWNVLTDLVGLGGIWWKLAWPTLETGGTPGIINALLVTLFMLGLTWGATRIGLKLKV